MVTTEIIHQLQDQRRTVDFDTYDITVQQLIAMVESKSINVAPVYQRKFRWDERRRSELIESVFLGVPVPSLFMASNSDGTWEVVDGVQRLSTILQFAGTPGARERLQLSPPLRVEGLEKLTSLNGLTFDQLPDSVRLQFQYRPIKVVTLSDKSDWVVRFDLFERLNTGGIELSNQEIRSCIYRGEFSHFLERLANDSVSFKRVLKLTKRQEEDKTREECALRFFAFLDRYKSFEHSVIEFLNEYMNSASESFDYLRQKKLFSLTFEQLACALPEGIVRGTGRKITPINLFEGVAVGAALALKQDASIKTDDIHRWINSNELRRYTTGATNNRKAVVGRIEYCRDRFLGE